MLGAIMQDVEFDVDPFIEKVMKFACTAHKYQKRKYTGEPYFFHCVYVANILHDFGMQDPNIIAAALLHDTIEDTSVTYQDIVDNFGKPVADLVLEVTDVSVPSDGNRATRKALDAAHIAKASKAGKLIKCADLIDNLHSICDHDINFARVYLREAWELLPLLGLSHPIASELHYLIICSMSTIVFNDLKAKMKKGVQCLKNL